MVTGADGKIGAALETAAEPVIPDSFDQGETPFIRPFMIDMASDHDALNIGLARRLLGWRPRHRILEGLKDLVAALTRDPEGWYEANGITLPPSGSYLRPSGRTTPSACPRMRKRTTAPGTGSSSARTSPSR